jgi:hypothetical protein
VCRHADSSDAHGVDDRGKRRALGHWSRSILGTESSHAGCQGRSVLALGLARRRALERAD